MLSTTKRPHYVKRAKNTTNKAGEDHEELHVANDDGDVGDHTGNTQSSIYIILY